MAFFKPMYTPRRRPLPLRAPAEKKSPARPRTGRIKPIIQRGPFALVWVNPDPPGRRPNHDGPRVA
jgi:hypothetical protein